MRTAKQRVIKFSVNSCCRVEMYVAVTINAYKTVKWNKIMLVTLLTHTTYTSWYVPDQVYIMTIIAEEKMMLISEKFKHSYYYNYAAVV